MLTGEVGSVIIIAYTNTETDRWDAELKNKKQKDRHSSRTITTLALLVDRLLILKLTTLSLLAKLAQILTRISRFFATIATMQRTERTASQNLRLVKWLILVHKLQSTELNF